MIYTDIYNESYKPMAGLRRQGGQRRQWLDDLCDWTDMSLPQLIRATEDRSSYRKLVHTASYDSLALLLLHGSMGLASVILMQLARSKNRRIL